MSKGPRDTRTPKHRQRRERHDAIDWCKHKWVVCVNALPPKNSKAYLRCKKCNKIKEN